MEEWAANLGENVWKVDMADEEGFDGFDDYWVSWGV